jgi:hypothetical protein
MDAASGLNGLRVLPLQVGLGTRTERDSPGNLKPGAALALGVSAEFYDEVVAPERLTRPGASGARQNPGSGVGRPEAEPGPSGLVGRA